MAKNPERNLLCALDIGTSKVVALVAEQDPVSEQLKIIGVGAAASRGLKKGVIVNIENTVQAIRQAVDEAEHMADCQIHEVTVGIAGAHIQCINSSGVVAIRGSEVAQADIDRVIDAAKAVAIPAEQRILHLIPQAFSIDNQQGIKEPLGMSGVRLEADVHMITGSISAAQNIIKCVNQCGIRVADIVLEQIASSTAVLSDDEKDLGVCMIDIGGGTADISVFVEGAIVHTAAIPIAGQQVTTDIAHALRTSTQYAEAIKLQHGVALVDMTDENDTFELAGMGDRPGRRESMETLANVIEARYEELFNLIHEDLRKAGFLNALSTGIVLTGGASKIPGAIELAEDIFRLPVRLGEPHYVVGLNDVVANPIHATGVGLLMYANQQSQEHTQRKSKKHHTATPAKAMNDDAANVFQKMRNWVAKHF